MQCIVLAELGRSYLQRAMAKLLPVPGMDDRGLTWKDRETAIDSDYLPVDEARARTG